jgi:hypothetical protein
LLVLVLAAAVIEEQHDPSKKCNSSKKLHSAAGRDEQHQALSFLLACSEK